MNAQAYLNRIDFQDTITIKKSVLFKLQKQHLLNIPFENLDIHYGRNIRLSIMDMYQKVVVEKRGGFCYELNGLFCDFLKQIGFNAKLISARVHTKEAHYSPEYDHLAILVQLDNHDFLVDVGFGKFSLEPLKLEIGQRILDKYGQFQFDKYDANYFRINEVKNNKLIPQYIFRNEERNLSEFAERCMFHQTSENSHFTKKKLISIAKKEGRITLNNSQLKITRMGVEEQVDFEENEFDAKLKQHFDIEIG
ncbi:arylamine N-acetyltransferase family protein [Zobellia roscoffensis]|uniref:arylamine N-acetyltransferase family protein n=1 Tax=Zobellia roscoffensis TaxID=2779508 RepID=UPI00188C37F9|nr:arylamine N-acetyltransferase [Zobellia roscoffensis]